MKLIYRAGGINEANIVASMLRANGIEAYVSGYYLQGGIGELAASDFAHVHVADEDVSAAQSIIIEYQGEPVSQSENEVEKKASAKSGLLIALLAAALILIFGFAVSR